MSEERIATVITADTETSLAALTPDPQNAESHDARNLALIADALRHVGAPSITVSLTGTGLLTHAVTA